MVFYVTSRVSKVLKHLIVTLVKSYGFSKIKPRCFQKRYNKSVRILMFGSYIVGKVIVTGLTPFGSLQRGPLVLGCFPHNVFTILALCFHESSATMEDCNKSLESKGTPPMPPQEKKALLTV